MMNYLKKTKEVQAWVYDALMLGAVLNIVAYAIDALVK